MRNRATFIILVILLAAFALPFAASAKVAAVGVPGGPFTTVFSVQNMSPDTEAYCSYDVYNNTGSTNGFATTALTAIDPGARAIVAVGSVSNFPTGTNSAVISCSEQVAVTVMFNDSNKNDAYTGISSPSANLFIPSMYKNYFSYSTSIRLQNASASASTGKIEYFLGAVKKGETAISLPANGSITLDQATVAGLVNNQSYSAQITLTQPAAAVVSIFGMPSTGVANQLYAFSAFASGSTGKIFAPVIMRNYYGYNTAITIQNIGAAPASVDLKYSNGTIRKHVLAPKAATVVLQGNETALAANTLYSAQIYSTTDNGNTPQPLIVTVNESTPTTHRATTYEGLASGGLKVAAPYIVKTYQGYNSSLTCQNVGTGAVTSLIARYYRVDSGGNVIQVNRTQTLPGGQLGVGKTFLIYPPADSAIPAAFYGSMIVEATTSNGGAIACVANIDQNATTAFTNQTKDRLSAYDGVIVP